MKRKQLNLSFFAIAVGLAFALPAHADGDKEMAEKLSILFRSARAVVSQNPDMIGDPKKAPDVDKFLDATRKNYARGAEKKLEEGDDATKALLGAIKDVVGKAKSGSYDSKWASAKEAPNKFLPARFAKEVADKFTASMKGAISIKLTTSAGLLVNTENKPDSWENDSIEGKFRKSKDGEAQAYASEADISGKKAFRYILPEYYSSTCLSCHGGDAGRKLHPDHSEGSVGSFGGAISIAIFKK